MNTHIIRFILSRILYLEAALLAFPLLIGVIYHETGADLFHFVIPLMLCLVLGKILDIDRQKIDNFYYREALLAVALVWVTVSAIGAIPLWLTPTNYHTYTDALFEMVSGFTTTGASVANDLEVLPHSILLWRSLSHFIGGMGVLVFALALFPKSNPRASLIMKAEVTGPTFGKLVPRLSDTARILYGIYIGMTVVLTIFLLFGGMNLFDAVTHAMGAAGTGGFSNYNASVGHFHSRYIEVVLGIAMFFFGINFNLYYYAIINSIKDFFKSEELKVYFAIVTLATIAIIWNIWSLYDSAVYTPVSAFFTVTSIISTGGFVSADFGQWPLFSKTILLILMFLGGCAGSTAGGFKISRMIITIKKLKNEILHVIDSKHVSVIRFEGKAIEPSVENAIASYGLLYLVIVGISILLINLQFPDLMSSTSAVLALFNNVGPGIGAYGPIANFLDAGTFSKWILILDMLIGRLEIYPMIALMLPRVWAQRRKRLVKIKSSSL
ncbi:MAG: TrkH family potassium uptake protein [Aerococcus sp.]|nr:TrkH family potassium uptake protein [Aerococcus sp.]